MSAGIFLEDHGVNLPWGSTCDDAWKIGNPKHYRDQSDKTRIIWSNKVLNGLNCDLLAYLPNGASLNEVSLWINRIGNANLVNHIDQYLFMKNHLSGMMGLPVEISTKGSALLAPILTWVSGKCTLQLITGDRFGEFTLLEIHHDCKPTFS